MLWVYTSGVSTARNAAIQRIEDTLRHFDDQDSKRNVAIAVANAIYPLITDAKQLRGVPEGSILVASYRGGLHRPLIWEDGKLHGRIPGTMDPVAPEQILARRSPLTVVWMP